MSTSLNVVSIAAVFCASFKRRATVWRRRVIRTRSSRRSPEGLAGGGGGGGAGGGGGGTAASESRLLAAARTSSLVSRPSLPVPLIFEGSSPCSSTRRRTEGDKVRWGPSSSS